MYEHWKLGELLQHYVFLLILYSNYIDREETSESEDEYFLV